MVHGYLLLQLWRLHRAGNLAVLDALPPEPKALDFLLRQVCSAVLFYTYTVLHVCNSDNEN
jgi:hypothetical protein